MSKTKESKPVKTTSFGLALFVVLATVVILVVGCIEGLQYRYLLLFVAVIAGGANMLVLNIPWDDCLEALCVKMKSVIPTLCMMWCTGGIIGTMIFCGAVPMVIYYGFMVISPKFIYLSAFLLCLIMSTLTGSSWTSAGTAGVAMYGMALGMGANMPIVVGAIVAGAIFGDKVSPLSETTNMAPACAGTNLYTHIGSMMYDTLPAAVISAVVFLIAGMTSDLGSAATDQSITTLMEELMMIYNFCWWKNILLLIPFAIIFYAALAKKPVIPALVLDIILSIILGMVCHGFTLANGMTAAYNGFNLGLIDTIPEGYEASAFLTKILVRGGSISMASVIFTCFTGFAAASMIARGGYLDCVLGKTIGNIKSKVGCVAAAELTMLAIMIATGTAYVGFIMLAEMYKKPFIKNRVGMPVLSRCMEDIGTCFGCLIPWSLSGAYYAGLFDNMPIWGSGGYALWTVLPYVTIIFAILLAITGIGMFKMSDEEAEAQMAELEAEATA